MKRLHKLYIFQRKVPSTLITRSEHVQLCNNWNNEMRFSNNHCYGSRLFPRKPSQWPWIKYLWYSLWLKSRHTLALPNCHGLIDSFTIFATWEPNQVIGKKVLCPTQSLLLSEFGLTSNIELFEMIKDYDFNEGMMKETPHLMFILSFQDNVGHLINAPEKIVGYIDNFHPSEMH